MTVLSANAMGLIARGFLILMLSFAVATSALANTGLKIPDLGSSAGTVFSAEYEYQLGRTWLKLFRSQVDVYEDPIMQRYVENLVYELVEYSELQDKRIEVVIVNNPTMNAFAVPGGVIGIHTGLFQFAQTEDQFASVIAHEIAHLSQRHFSRRVEFAKTQQPLALAGLLAGLVLIATTGSDMGLAALTATQAATQDAALRYSRGNEQEADRIGMQTLAMSGRNPAATPAMFEQMLRAARYASSNRIPEFLRSHPLSESRISDTKNRLLQYPAKQSKPSLDYHLMKAKVQVDLAESPETALAQFKGQEASDASFPEAHDYGLALALSAAGRFDEARAIMESLLENRSSSQTYLMSLVDIAVQQRDTSWVLNTLDKATKLNPGNKALALAYARALMTNQQAHIAEAVLEPIARDVKNDPLLWYWLAEIQGLSGDIQGLHQARGEYFLLHGIADEAEKQFRYALRLARNDFVESSKIEERLKAVYAFRDRLEEL
ncbi:MAG: M48 family metalloprotease [Halieaceae bacterium]|nr:M48 family metalloprotease [Halieaceae bacterium]